MAKKFTHVLLFHTNVNKSSEFDHGPSNSCRSFPNLSATTGMWYKIATSVQWELRHRNNEGGGDETLSFHAGIVRHPHRHRHPHRQRPQGDGVNASSIRAPWMRRQGGKKCRDRWKAGLRQMKNPMDRCGAMNNGTFPPVGRDFLLMPALSPPSGGRGTYLPISL